MTKTVETDICVIGTGSGGLTVAAVSAQLGAATVLVEKHKMGGDCLNYGCVPSKALLAAADTAATVRRASRLGIDLGESALNGDGAFAHVQNAIAAIAPHDSIERFEGYGAQVILAPARFIGRREIEADDYKIRARRFVIATGSGPSVPPIPGLADARYFTNETIFDQKTVPRHLVIVGGGPIGVEMAQAHRRLGAEVTLLEMARILPNDDPELVDILRQRLIGEGIQIVEGVTVTSVSSSSNGVAIRCDDAANGREFTGSHVLVAAGRRPNTDGLDLEKAGITYSSNGIEVDSRLRTANHNVFAVGDVTGGHQFTHIAGYHAGIVIRNALFRLPAKVDTAAYPWVTYTRPELAHVGKTAADAAGLSGVRILKWPFSDNDRAIVEGESDGMVKVVTKKGRVLGASILGPHAGELIQTWQLAIQARLKIAKIANMIAPYPTFGEANKRAAAEYFTPALFGSRSRRLVKFLRSFG